MFIETEVPDITFNELVDRWNRPTGYLSILVSSIQAIVASELIPSEQSIRDYDVARTCLEILVERSNGHTAEIPYYIGSLLLSELFPQAVVESLRAALALPTELPDWYMSPDDIARLEAASNFIELDTADEPEPEPEVPIQLLSEPAPKAVFPQIVEEPPEEDPTPWFETIAPTLDELAEIERVLAQPALRIKKKKSVDLSSKKTRKEKLPLIPKQNNLEKIGRQPRIKRSDVDNYSEPFDEIGQMLKEIGETRLLTYEEEVSLAKRIETGKAAQEELAVLQQSFILLPEEETRKFELEELVQDGEEAREHMIKANGRLVVSIAKRYQHRGVELVDLVQSGQIGLIRSVEKFEYQRGHKFSTYATWWIRQAVSRSVADYGRTIRIPVHMFERKNHLNKVQAILTQELGRPATFEDVVLAYVKDEIDVQELTIEEAKRDFLHVYIAKKKEVTELMELRADIGSLDTPVGEDGDTDFGDFIADTSSNTEEAGIDNIRNQTIQEMMRLISFRGSIQERQMRILGLRYGVSEESGGRDHTLEEVGQMLGVTRERIRQLEGDAKNTIRRSKYGVMLRELFDTSEG